MLITRATVVARVLNSALFPFLCFLWVDIAIIAQYSLTCLANLQRAYLNTFVRYCGFFLVLPLVELLKFTCLLMRNVYGLFSQNECRNECQNDANMNAKSMPVSYTMDRPCKVYFLSTKLSKKSALLYICKNIIRPPSSKTA